MRNFLLVAITVVILAGISAAQDVESAKPENAMPKEAVSFDGQTLVLVWEGGKDGERVKEFIPDGQKLDSWTSLASIREYPKLNDHRAVVTNLVRHLRTRDPQSRIGLIENPGTGDMIVDFVTWPDDASFVEFNIFKYSKNPSGGVVAQQYALRAYGDTNEFFHDLKADRERLINLMAVGGLVRIDPVDGR